MWFWITIIVLIICETIIQVSDAFKHRNKCKTCMYLKCTSNHSPCIVCESGSEYEEKE